MSLCTLNLLETGNDLIPIFCMVKSTLIELIFYSKLISSISKLFKRCTATTCKLKFIFHETKELKNGKKTADIQNQSKLHIIHRQVQFRRFQYIIRSLISVWKNFFEKDIVEQFGSPPNTLSINKKKIEHAFNSKWKKAIEFVSA